jgi:hypothetical protein
MSALGKVFEVFSHGLVPHFGGKWFFHIGGHKFETGVTTPHHCQETESILFDFSPDGQLALKSYKKDEKIEPLEHARVALANFVRGCDGLRAVKAQQVLLRILLNQRAEAFNILADMIDPGGKSYWRLELRRRRGRSRKISTEDQQLLACMYRWILNGLKAKNRASPAKTARGLLAAKLNMTDEEIRANIERGQGRRRRKGNVANS